MNELGDIDQQLAGKRGQLDALRPITHASLTALAKWYDIELTYTSNAIEGNTLTRAETAIVLEKGLTVNGKPLRDHLEAVGHQEALDYVRRLVRTDDPVREIDVRHIHSLVVGRTDAAEAGKYSEHQRMIAGSPLVLPSPLQIGPLMSDLGQWLAQAPSTAETAVAAHEKLVSIHPFSNGNGRTARLLMNLVLFKGGNPPIVVGPEQRTKYIEGLEAIQVRNDPRPYRHFMAARLSVSLDHHIDVLRQSLI